MRQLNRSMMEDDQESAQWSDLPEELLHLVSHRLPGSLRLQSVCSAWRGSTIPRQPRFPPSLLHRPTGLYLSRRTIFALSPPPGLHNSPGESNAWLIKLEDQAYPGNMRLCYPLRGEYVLGPLPSCFPRKIDLLELGVVELRHEYVLWSYDASFNLPLETVRCDKLAVCFLGKEDNGFVVLALSFPGRLLSMYRAADGGKRVAYDETRRFADLVFFQGMFYTVDLTGTTFVITPESMEVTQTLATKVEMCGDTKRMVECGKELLLLVDMCTKQTCCGSEERIRFKFFKLHRNGKSWVESSGVGDNVVFLGEKSSFCVPASTLGCKGNRIVYEQVELEAAMGRIDDCCGLMAEDDVLGCGFIKVFDVGSGQVEDLTAVPELMRLFWPPPSWICASKSR